MRLWNGLKFLYYQTIAAMRLMKRQKVQSTGSLVDVMNKDALKPRSGERFPL